MASNYDIFYMQRALTLAQRASITAVKSKPRVGAVIVKKGKIIGEGYHRVHGKPHAEIDALNHCKTSPQGATIYTTLEPCSHFGMFPPCTEAIIKAGIVRVVCATRDPNPLVIREKGIKAMRRKSIEVDIGLCSQEAVAINEPFFHYYKTGKPFVAIKIASSLDGKIATLTGDSKWITSKEARDYARTKIRSEYQAILVGVNTVLADDPHLGIRKKGIPDPLRIVLDSQLRTPNNAKLLRDKNVILAVGSKASHKRIHALTAKGYTVWRFPSHSISIPQLLKKLAENKITSVLVEGGGETVGGFLDTRAVNKVYWFHAPLIIGGKNSTSSVGGDSIDTISQALTLKNIDRIPLGRDLLTVGYLN